MGLFHVSPNFDFTTSEPVGDYYIKAWYIRVPSRIAEGLKSEELRKTENMRKVSKLHRMTVNSAAPFPNKNFVISSKKGTKNSD